MTGIPRYVTGQRVRINKEEGSMTHIGKMATIKRVEVTGDREPSYALQVDRVPMPASFPESFLEPVQVKPSSLLANDLFLPWDPDPDSSPRLKAFTEDAWIAGRIMEDLLLYNQVVIPTVDYAVIVPLVHWLGANLVREMLESDALSFVRFRGGLGYIGNGVGLALYEIHAGRRRAEPWIVKAARSTPEGAVILQLNNRLKGLDDELIHILGRFVEICTVDTALPEFTQKVEAETYRDILGSDLLRDHFSVRNTHLKSLSGLQPDQMRTFTSMVKPAVAGDEINTTLRLGMLNLEAYLAEEAGTRDMVTDRGFGRLLDAKIERFTGGAKSRGSFSHLVALEQLPDIAASIADGKGDLAKIWKFRNTRNAGEFREWFDEVGPADHDAVLREYGKALKAGGLFGSGPRKIIRFIVVQGVGLVLSAVTGGLAGIAASVGLSASDSFLLERVRRGYSPRYFIDDLRHKFFKP